MHHVVETDDIIRASHRSTRSAPNNESVDAVTADNVTVDELDDEYGEPASAEKKPQTEAQWAACGFIKPLHAVTELSSFPLLTSLHKILASLATTSSNAARVMSQEKIAKNSMRTTMLDEWFHLYYPCVRERYS